MSKSEPSSPVGRPSGVCLTSPDCVKVLDADGCVEFFNPDGLRLMEIDDLKDVEGLYWPDLWPVHSRDLAIAALSGAKTAGVATFQAQCPTAKGKLKWWDVTVAASPDRPGNLIVISRDITDRRAAAEASQVDHDRLNAILRSNPDVLWDIDLATDTVWWGEGMTSTFGYGPDQIGTNTKWCHDHIHPDDRARVIAAMERAVVDGSASWEDEFRYRAVGGDYIEVFDRGSIIRDAEGRAIRFVGVMQDITARNQLANVHRVVAGEMAHRVNNLLAVVSGLFQQSTRSSKTLDELTVKYSDRLMALANANTAMLKSFGRGAKLRDIADVQLGAFVGARRIILEGDDTSLPEQLAQPIALALNELATNALKYGALSNSEGVVSLSWKSDPNANRVVIDWQERGGPPVSEPARVGSGTMLIERGIAGATVERHFPRSGFICRLEVPLSRE